MLVRTAADVIDRFLRLHWGVDGETTVDALDQIYAIQSVDQRCPRSPCATVVVHFAEDGDCVRPDEPDYLFWESGSGRGALVIDNRDGVAVAIAVDCGTSAREEIERYLDLCREVGMAPVLLIAMAGAVRYDGTQLTVRAGEVIEAVGLWINQASIWSGAEGVVQRV